MAQKISNKNYRKFLDSGEIDLITEDHILRALRNIKGHHVREAQALLIALYYTGARPNEILRMVGKDVQKKGRHIMLHVKGSKKGLPRVIYLPWKKELVKILYGYAASVFPDMFLFYHYRNKYTRTTINKKGEIKSRDEISNKLLYHMKIWFDGVVEGSIPTYFLRHNRFSSLSMKGVDMQQIRMIKGSKTYDSIMPYLHMSSKAAEEVSKKME